MNGTSNISNNSSCDHPTQNVSVNLVDKVDRDRDRDRVERNPSNNNNNNPYPYPNPNIPGLGSGFTPPQTHPSTSSSYSYPHSNSSNNNVDTEVERLLRENPSIALHMDIEPINYSVRSRSTSTSKEKEKKESTKLGTCEKDGSGESKEKDGSRYMNRERLDSNVGGVEGLGHLSMNGIISNRDRDRDRDRDSDQDNNENTLHRPSANTSGNRTPKSGLTANLANLSASSASGAGEFLEFSLGDISGNLPHIRHMTIRQRLNRGITAVGAAIRFKTSGLMRSRSRSNSTSTSSVGIDPDNTGNLANSQNSQTSTSTAISISDGVNDSPAASAASSSSYDYFSDGLASSLGTSLGTSLGDRGLIGTTTTTTSSTTTAGTGTGTGTMLRSSTEKMLSSSLPMGELLPGRSVGLSVLVLVKEKERKGYMSLCLYFSISLFLYTVRILFNVEWCSGALVH